MNFLQVLILAVLQGISGFLPISSTGHLVVIGHLLMVDAENGVLLAGVLNIGSLLAIIVILRNDVVNLGVALWDICADVIGNGKTLWYNKRQNDARRYRKILSNDNRKFATMIMISLIPTVIIELFLKTLVQNFQSSLLATGAGLLITTVFLLVASFTRQGKKKPLDIDYRVAVLIGVLQGFAGLPGISRLGITIAVCLICGFTCKFAIKYSFILNIPITIGTSIITLTTLSKNALNVEVIVYCILGILIVAIVGLICAKMTISLIRINYLEYFAGYSLIIGIVALVYHFI